MSWWQQPQASSHVGRLLFPGRWVARPEDFASLERDGVSVGAPVRQADGTWTVLLEHRAWGRATLGPDREPWVPSEQLLRGEPRLGEAQKATLRRVGTSLWISAEPRSGNVLADRKDLLRFLRAALGGEGLAALDRGSQAFWFREELDLELAHEAELDISALYGLHLIVRDGEEGAAGRKAFWLHSHGLHELGFQDFDVIDPAEGFPGELTRALAFAAVEGQLAQGSTAPLGPGVVVRGVPAREFLARAASEEHRDYREDADDYHLDGHVVLCEPERRGLLSWLRGRAPPRPSRALSATAGEGRIVWFSRTATDLMARRARQTLPLLRRVLDELADFEFRAGVKLGYPVDGDAAKGSEHLWFQVHRLGESEVDATLLNRPVSVEGLREGDRRPRQLELLSDWTLQTPWGTASPRETRVLAFLWDHRDKLREAFAEEARKARS